MQRRSSITFSRYFHKWITAVKKPEVSGITYAKYTGAYAHVQEWFADEKLTDISRMEYQQKLSQFAQTHAHTTCLGVHRIMHACFEYAVYDGIIERNPSFKAKVGGVETSRKKALHHINTLDAEQTKTLIAALHPLVACTPKGPTRPAFKGNQYYDLMILIALHTGMRLAEVIGLTWDRVDLGRRPSIRVDRTRNWKRPDISTFIPTKTRSSMRDISIDDGLADLLTDYKKIMAPESDTELVFALVGSITKCISSNINLRLQCLQEQTGLPQFHYHQLRHTHGSLLLSQGVPIIAISRRLGHANVSITQDIYVHEIAESQKANDQMIINAIEKIA